MDMPAIDDAPPDEQLVARVLRGEVAAFADLMRRHNRRVYRAVRSILKDDSMIEEVMQQSYLLAFSHLAQFRGESKVSTWMVRIALNEAMTTARKAHRFEKRAESNFETAEDPMTNVPSNEPGPDEAAENRELTGLLEQTVDSLPDIYRTVLILREVEGMSTAETAEALSVTEDVVKTRLSRAKQQARAELMERLGGLRESCFPFHAVRCERVISGVIARIHASERLT